MTELLQRELQTVAPLPEARVRIREHPRNALDIRKFDLAGVAAKRAIVISERRLVAARARKIILQFLHLTHAPLYSTPLLALPDPVLT